MKEPIMFLIVYNGLKRKRLLIKHTNMSSQTDSPVRTTNFMNGVSFKLGALQTLQIVMTSMISGEAQYYRPSGKSPDNPCGERTDKKSDNSSTSSVVSKPTCRINNKAATFKNHFLLGELYESETSETTESYMSNIVKNALDEDFEGTVNFISTLRDEYMMRLNPQILLVSALLHNSRAKFNKSNPNLMRAAIAEAGVLPTDWCKQFELLKMSGVTPPSIWKRAIAKKLEDMSRYHALKYINGGKTGKNINKIESSKSLASLVDLIRITHPKGEAGSVVSELVKTGKITSSDDSEETWERLRSSGKTWREIVSQIRIPHMALLRNIRNIIQEYSQNDSDRSDEIAKIGDQLVAGVEGGKQFPFRYFSAHRALGDDSHEKFGYRRRGSERRKNSESQTHVVKDVAMNPKYIEIIEKALERCLKKSLGTIPRLEGRVDSLTDNSGSAHGAFVSEYGSVKVAEISNLSAILTAMRATEGGSVWIFGDSLKEFRVDPEGSILNQLDQVNKIGQGIGGGTETGVWLFWEKMLTEKKKLDNVFIYSDQQAGYGGLYADQTNLKRMREISCLINDDSSYNRTLYIDVLQLVKQYRSTVNPKMNIFSIQVAGYDNTVLPDLMYRGAILSGWTGKEATMAYHMIKQWDQAEQSQDQDREEDIELPAQEDDTSSGSADNLISDAVHIEKDKKQTKVMKRTKVTKTTKKPSTSLHTNP